MYDSKWTDKCKILRKIHSKTGPRDGPGDFGGHLGHHQTFYSKTVSCYNSFRGGFWIAFGTLGRPKASATLFCRTFWGDILDQKAEKRHRKRHAKINTEKHGKIMQKGTRNDAKMEAEIYDGSCSLEIGEC